MQIVVPIVSGVTSGLRAPGVQSGSGRPLVLTQFAVFVRAGGVHANTMTVASGGGSILVPVHITWPSGVWAQCSQPLVNVGVLVLFRQKARPAVVFCSVSPV